MLGADISAGKALESLNLKVEVKINRYFHKNYCYSSFVLDELAGECIDGERERLLLFLLIILILSHYFFATAVL